MARYEHLPIYKAAMDLTVYIETIVRNFSRYPKYTLGSELRQQSRELVTLIIRANSRPDGFTHFLKSHLATYLECFVVGGFRNSGYSEGTGVNTKTLLGVFDLRLIVLGYFQ